MPFDLGESINAISDSLLKAPAIHSIAQNPLYTALIITFVLMLTVLFIFRDVDSDESLLLLTARTGFWTLLFVTGLLILHNKVYSAEIRVGAANDAYENVFEYAGKPISYTGGTESLASGSVLEDAVLTSGTLNTAW